MLVTVILLEFLFFYCCCCFYFFFAATTGPPWQVHPPDQPHVVRSTVQHGRCHNTQPLLHNASKIRHWFNVARLFNAVSKSTAVLHPFEHPKHRFQQSADGRFTVLCCSGFVRVEMCAHQHVVRHECFAVDNVPVHDFPAGKILIFLPVDFLVDRTQQSGLLIRSTSNHDTTQQWFFFDHAQRCHHPR